MKSISFSFLSFFGPSYYLDNKDRQRRIIIRQLCGHQGSTEEDNNQTIIWRPRVYRGQQSLNYVDTKGPQQSGNSAKTYVSPSRKLF